MKSETKNENTLKKNFMQLRWADVSKNDNPLNENEYEKTIRSIRKKIIYSIPHEMCTPLHLIMNFGELIKETETTHLSYEEVSELGDAILKSAHQLNQLIQKYLMYIDVETDGNNFATKEVRMTPEYFRKTLANIVEKYCRNNDFIINVDTLCPQIKENWISFAIKELVDNSFKFSTHGEKVIIKTKETTQGYEIIIHDEGRGFPTGAIEKINAFEQFDRRKIEQQGVGLGLFLAKKIIEKHNGKIKINNNAPKGTTVIIELLHIYSEA